MQMKEKTLRELEKFEDRRKIGLENSLKKKEKKRENDENDVFFIFPPI